MGLEKQQVGINRGWDVGIQVAAKLVRIGARAQARAREINVFAGMASRDRVKARGVHRGRRAPSELRDGSELPGGMDVIDVVGESLAERYTGPDQCRRGVRIVCLRWHDPSARR